MQRKDAYLDSDVAVLDVSRVQHDGAALVDAVVFGGDVLDHQAVDFFDEPVAVLNSLLLLVPLDQRCRVGLDFTAHFVSRAGDRILFGGSVHPRDIVCETRSNNIIDLRFR